MQLSDITTAREWAVEVDRRYSYFNGDVFCADPQHERTSLSCSMFDLIIWLEDHWDCRNSENEIARNYAEHAADRAVRDAAQAGATTFGDVAGDAYNAAMEEHTRDLGARASRLRTVPDVKPGCTHPVLQTVSESLGHDVRAEPSLPALSCSNPECGATWPLYSIPTLILVDIEWTVFGEECPPGKAFDYLAEAIAAGRSLTVHRGHGAPARLFEPTSPDRVDIPWTQAPGCPECGHGTRQDGCACCTLLGTGVHR